MAYCEKCKKDGYAPSQMFVRMGEDVFVGPCCQQMGDRPVVAAQFQPPVRVVLPLQPNADFEYGVEFSNKKGVHAYLNYSGLQVTFDRSAEDIRRWAESQGIVDVRKTNTR